MKTGDIVVRTGLSRCKMVKGRSYKVTGHANKNITVLDGFGKYKKDDFRLATQEERNTFIKGNNMKTGDIVVRTGLSTVILKKGQYYKVLKHWDMSITVLGGFATYYKNGFRLATQEERHNFLLREDSTMKADNIATQIQLTKFKIREGNTMKTRVSQPSSQEWSFVIHDLRQINEDEIVSNLTVDNPVALLKYDGVAEAFYHDSIVTKAYLLGIESPKVTKVKHFTRAMKFARKVRNAEWDSSESTVSVVCPYL